MNKKHFIIIVAFMAGTVGPLFSKGFGEWAVSILVGAYIKVDEFKNRIPLEQLPTVVHDDLKKIMDLLVAAKEHVSHDQLYRLPGGLESDLFMPEEIVEIEGYLRPFFPEVIRYNGIQLNNYRWFFRGVATASTLIFGGLMLYSKSSAANKVFKAFGMVAAGYFSYRLTMALASRVFNFAGNREFLKNARHVLNRSLDDVPYKFYDFHQKYQPMTDSQLLEAFNKGFFVKDIIESLIPKGLI